MRQDEVFETIVNNNSYEVLWITEPGILNLRLERQKGTFLISGSIGKRITDLLPMFTTSESLKKIVIPTSLAIDAFRILEKVGINHSRLFSDIDGLGRDVKNEILHQVTYIGR